MSHPNKAATKSNHRFTQLTRYSFRVPVIAKAVILRDHIIAVSVEWRHVDWSKDLGNTSSHFGTKQQRTVLRLGLGLRLLAL